MTKKEMLKEMFDGLNLVNSKESIERRMNNSKKRIEEVYNWYINISAKDHQAKIICLHSL